MPLLSNPCWFCHEPVYGVSLPDVDKEMDKHIQRVHPEKWSAYTKHERKCPYCDEVVYGSTQFYVEKNLEEHIARHLDKELPDHSLSKQVASTEVRYWQLQKQNQNYREILGEAEELIGRMLDGLVDEDYADNTSFGMLTKDIQTFIEKWDITRLKNI